MEELGNLLKLKEENRFLREENALIKSELKIFKERSNDSISLENSSLKVKELKMLLEKYKKEKTDLKEKIIEAENFADKRNEEILSALVNGSYGITFEDFIINLSANTFLKIPIDAIFSEIKSKVFEKFNANLEKKNKELEELIQKNKKQAAVLKNAKLQFDILLNQRLHKIEKDFDKKFDAEIKLIKKKHDDQILLLKNEQILKGEHIPDFISTLKGEYKFLKKQYEDNIKSVELVEISMNLLKNENSGLKKENIKLSDLLGKVEFKLQNCQKELSKHLNKSQVVSSTLNIQSNPESKNVGFDSDGSKGWHDVARESGKFGSLPSFDNYDDDYLDNFKEGFD